MLLQEALKATRTAVSVHATAAPMPMWPISTRVNKPENDDPSIPEPIDA
jgi:hypothetical protein